MSCRSTLKSFVTVPLKILNQDYDKMVTGTYSALIGAMDKMVGALDPTTYTEFDYSNFTGKIIDQAKDMAADVKSVAVWVFIKLLQTSTSLISKGIVAYALLRLRDQLVKRKEVSYKIIIQLNVIKTCLHIINENLYPYERDNSLLNKITTANYYVKKAMIRSRQFVSIWEETGVYHDGIFRQIVRNLQTAQDYLIAEEIQVYQDALQDVLVNEVDIVGNLAGRGFLDINSLLDAIGGNIDPSDLSGRALIALEPLYSLVSGRLEDRKTRIVFAYKLGIQALIELSNLTPTGHKLLWSMLKSSGYSMVSATGFFDDDVLLGKREDYFARYVNKDLDTLLELNGAVNNKIQALQYIEQKFIDLSAVTAPLVNFIDKNTRKLEVVHEDMKDVLYSNTSEAEAYSKLNAWSSEIADIQASFQFTPPIAGEAIEDITSWANDWNTILNFLDSYDTTNNNASAAYGRLFNLILVLPTAFTSRAQHENVKEKLIIISNDINSSIFEDDWMIKEIDALELWRLPELETVENILDFADSAFPLLGEIIRNADIEKLNQAVKEITKSYVYSIEDIKDHVAGIGKSVTWVVNQDVRRKIASCFKGSEMDVDLNFDTGADDESSRDLINITNFKDQNAHSYQNTNDALDNGSEVSVETVRGKL